MLGGLVKEGLRMWTKKNDFDGSIRTFVHDLLFEFMR